MLTNHVVSQGLAEELKKAGWPQRESFFSWHEVNYRGEKEWMLGETNMQFAGMIFQSISAPFASELMESIPGSVLIWVASVGTTCETYWFCQGQDQPCFHRETLPDALAKLALHLMKEGKWKP